MEAVRPRIASRVTPSLRPDQPGLDNMLDMIEFPHRDSPLQIAVCPSTGNFMVCFYSLFSISKNLLRNCGEWGEGVDLVGYTRNTCELLTPQPN